MHPVPKEGRAFFIDFRDLPPLTYYSLDFTSFFATLLQVGVRQVPKEGGLFEIIFYPFVEANGTLEVRVGFRV